MLSGWGRLGILLLLLAVVVGMNTSRFRSMDGATIIEVTLLVLAVMLGLLQRRDISDPSASPQDGPLSAEARPKRLTRGFLMLVILAMMSVLLLCALLIHLQNIHFRDGF